MIVSVIIGHSHHSIVIVTFVAALLTTYARDFDTAVIDLLLFVINSSFSSVIALITVDLAIALQSDYDSFSSLKLALISSFSRRPSSLARSALGLSKVHT